jgi:hypothetical protein
MLHLTSSVPGFCFRDHAAPSGGLAILIKAAYKQLDHGFVRVHEPPTLIDVPELDASGGGRVIRPSDSLTWEGAPELYLIGTPRTHGPFRPRAIRLSSATREESILLMKPKHGMVRFRVELEAAQLFDRKLTLEGFNDREPVMTVAFDPEIPVMLFRKPDAVGVRLRPLPRLFWIDLDKKIATVTYRLAIPNVREANCLLFVERYAEGAYVTRAEGDSERLRETSVSRTEDLEQTFSAPLPSPPTGDLHAEAREPGSSMTNEPEVPSAHSHWIWSDPSATNDLAELSDKAPIPLGDLSVPLTERVGERVSLTGVLQLTLDPRRSLRRLIELALIFALPGGAIQAVAERMNLDTLERVPAPMIDELRQRVVDSWQQEQPSYPPTFLLDNASRVLLEERGFETTLVFGAPHAVGHLHGLIPMPCYFPLDAMPSFPMLLQLGVSIVGEIMPRQDARERASVCIRAIALRRR